ncbi:ATL52 [Ecytonucleospora hepatopenaei]|uniref:ATL52 n=1 Tax=Ecytonucleospora hepatopenaei TaxID=646526 RepID=A0A1W0E6K5_9MICR|nr:ATL52 [Ecytonucleospora hepatopenaei]
MLSLIQNIIEKPEIKRQVDEFYTSYRFFILQALYYLSLCAYTLFRCIKITNYGANGYLLTFFVILIGVTLFKLLLIYKKQSMAVFPSLFQFLFFPESEQKLLFLVFVVNPLFYLVLIKTLRGSTHFYVDIFVNLFFETIGLYILPTVFEITILIFLMIILSTADVVAKKLTVTKELEKTLNDDGVDCLICKCEFEKNEILTILKCKHKFHDDCITTWFKVNNACPLCKQTLLQKGSLRQIVAKY